MKKYENDVFLSIYIEKEKQIPWISPYFVSFQQL